MSEVIRISMYEGDERAFVTCFLLCGKVRYGGVSIINAKNAKGMQVNEDIRDAQVRVIGPEGEQLGIFSAKEAQMMANDQDLDLVKIAPQSNPPVCKIMDYSKYCFEQVKREKEVRKNQRVIVLKEIKLSVKIEDHDLNTKLNHAVRFLNSGNKIKVTLRFKSREIQHPELGTKLMERFAAGVSELGVVEKAAKLDGRMMTMILAPKAAK